MKPNSLDYWRDYFSTADRDVFDVIDGAIMVAASDCPQVFKLRRDRIAESLFSCRLALCSGCERVELFVPSEGAAVSRDNGEDDDGLMKSRIAGDADHHGGSKGSKVNSTGSDGTGDFMMNRESNYSFGDAEALTDEMEEESRILEEVSRIKDIVLNYEEESESVLFESLRRLQFMSLTVGMLKGTELGIAVNPLRKHRSKQINRLAQSLITVWKSSVDEWMQTTIDIPSGTPDSVNPSTVVDEEDEEGLPSPPLDEGAFLAAQPTSMELSGFFDGMDDDGNACAIRELPKKSEIRRKSTLHNPNRNGNIDQRMEKRSNDVKNQVTDKKPQPLKKETAVIKSNRLSNGNSEPMRLSNPSGDRKINMELKPQPRRLEKPATTMQGWASGCLQDDSKCMDKEAAAQMKLEATKRKLQERYQQAENAKKQRTVQVMDLHDLPKQAANRRNPPSKPGNHNRHWANRRR
ncbi:hypothetical protein MLD38_030991 [Melastoma candidum]|uniref:Uncharacterized protein n=1 Tax=Melastoma candidum TaxID=119954 RepID=A0ACB9MQA1_9MYRT|nr:hypothetical protein MLD38_030991 [Melastoma candidum]